MINLSTEDSLAWAGTANEDDVILMASSHGRLNAFPVREVRKASPTSKAVKVRTGRDGLPGLRAARKHNQGELRLGWGKFKQRC